MLWTWRPLQSVTQIVWSYLTIHSLNTISPLSIIPAYQRQHYHHETCSIITFLTSFTLNMSSETFQTGQSNLRKMTKDRHHIWMQKICPVFITQKVYIMVTCVAVLLPRIGDAQHTVPTDWHDHAHMAIALIHHKCCDEHRPLINTLDNPVKIQ